MRQLDDAQSSELEGDRVQSRRRKFPECVSVQLGEGLLGQLDVPDFSHVDGALGRRELKEVVSCCV